MKFQELISILESQDNTEIIKNYWDEAKTKPKYEAWYKDDKRHRLDGPAYQSWYEDGQKQYDTWYKDDKLHRVDGPAFQSWQKDGQKEYEFWYINNVEYTKEQFEEYIKGLDNKEDKEMISDLGQSFD